MQDLYRPNKIEIIASTAVAVSHTGDTNEFTFATIAIPVLGPNDRIEWEYYWTFPNSANAKTVRARFSGGSGTIYSQSGPTTNVATRIGGFIQNRNATNSQMGANLQSNGGWGAGATAMATSAVNTAAASSLVFTGQLASAAETLILESYLVRLLKG